MEENINTFSKERSRGVWTELKWLRMGTEEGSCEQGNGPLGLKRAENCSNKDFASRS